MRKAQMKSKPFRAFRDCSGQDFKVRKKLIVLRMLLCLAAPTFLEPALFPQTQGNDLDQEASFNRAWAENAFASISSEKWISDRLLLVHEDTPGDTRKDRSSSGSKMQLGERIYERGIGVSSRTVLRVELVHPAARFRANIGVDRFCDAIDSSVRFLVKAGGRDVFISEFMKASDRSRTIDVPLNGAKAFDLVVEPAPDSKGPNRADWANGSLLLEDGSQLQLDQLADQWRINTDLPFSFALGGKSSREFIAQWKSEVRTEKIDDNRLRRTVTLQDSKTGLEVRAVATVYTDTPGVDWTLYLTNRGSKDSPIIEKFNALDVTVDPGVGTMPVLQRLHGSDAQVDDWLPYDDPLKPGQRIEFSPPHGRSSEGSCPYFTLQYGGGGVTTAIGWSGKWHVATEWEKGGKLRLQAGLPNLHLTLHPGETIRSPRILQVYWHGIDRYRAYNLFRATMLSHIVPRVNGAVVVPPIVHMSTSFYEMNDSTESNVLSHLDSVKGLGFEMFWLDAYWTKGGFPQGMGNYGFPLNRVEPSDRFPRGLKPIGDAVHRDGMGFVLWFEPERVFRGTYLAKEHPEWVVKLVNSDNGLFNLGLPQAREYMTKYLIAAIKQYGVDCLRIDYNFDPAPYWKQIDAGNPSRVGLGEIRYIEGFYRMWDDILKAYPNLFIDDCAGGGRRIDLETSSRSIPLWRTDGTITPLLELNYDQAALQNQVMTAGLSRYVPFSTSGQMGATPYLFRSGFNGGISFAEDLRTPAYPRELLRQGIDEGKRIRKYFFGNFYPLNPVTTNPEDWSVLQYHRVAEQDGMVLAFRRDTSPYRTFDTALHEIAPDAKYDVTFYHTYSPEKNMLLSGSDLQHLELQIDDYPGSLLVEYRRVKE
jgi:alpha-galactosidase